MPEALLIKNARLVSEFQTLKSVLIPLPGSVVPCTEPPRMGATNMGHRSLWKVLMTDTGTKNPGGLSWG